MKESKERRTLLFVACVLLLFNYYNLVRRQRERQRAREMDHALAPLLQRAKQEDFKRALLAEPDLRVEGSTVVAPIESFPPIQRLIDDIERNSAQFPEQAKQARAYFDRPHDLTRRTNGIKYRVARDSYGRLRAVLTDARLTPDLVELLRKRQAQRQ